MNQHILNTEVQNFINENLNSDITKLLFSGSPFTDITIQELVEQIESKIKCKSKLPSWFKTKNIYCPNKLNIAQTSSEVTAKYKSSLISGNTLIDLTGGFGVDCVAFANTFKKVIHCEINNALSTIVKHNFKILKKSNITTLAIDGLQYLQQQQQQQQQQQPFDWIYIDPSRRNDVKGKVFLLHDCLPNVPEHLELLFKHTKNILIKASPMLDITNAINELSFVKEVHVIAVQNEVKEVLYVLEKGYKNKIDFKTINITKQSNQTFYSNLNFHEASYGLPQKYLYEPNVAILKSGLFNEVSSQLNIYKLHKNSHLYTNKKLIEFPGRRFEINKISTYNIKKLKNLIPEKKANITVRNFPETVVQIRKKTKIKEGGDVYLFFTTNIENKLIVLICKKC